MPLYYTRRRSVGGIKVLSIEAIIVTITIVHLRQVVS
jgi:hypothetical protein